MKYTFEERVEIGRQIYENELTKYEASEKYGISIHCSRDYMRLYRDKNRLQPKNVIKAEVSPFDPDEYVVRLREELSEKTREELINELIRYKSAAEKRKLKRKAQKAEEEE